MVGLASQRDCTQLNTFTNLPVAIWTPDFFGSALIVASIILLPGKLILILSPTSKPRTRFLFSRNSYSDSKALSKVVKN